MYYLSTSCLLWHQYLLNLSDAHKHFDSSFLLYPFIIINSVDNSRILFHLERNHSRRAHIINLIEIIHLLVYRITI